MAGEPEEGCFFAARRPLVTPSLNEREDRPSCPDAGEFPRQILDPMHHEVDHLPRALDTPLHADHACTKHNPPVTQFHNTRTTRNHAGAARGARSTSDACCRSDPAFRFPCRLGRVQVSFGSSTPGRVKTLADRL